MKISLFPNHRVFKALQRRRTPAKLGKKKGEPFGSPLFLFLTLLFFASNNAGIFVIPSNTYDDIHKTCNRCHTVPHLGGKCLLFANSETVRDLDPFDALACWQGKQGLTETVIAVRLTTTLGECVCNIRNIHYFKFHLIHWLRISGHLCFVCHTINILMQRQKYIKY